MSADLRSDASELAALRPRFGGAVLPRLIAYQLTLLARSPIGTFISLIIPLMLLVALDLVTPEMTLRSLNGIRISQFLTPAMASFAVLNVGFVDLVIGMTLARDEGVLHRFHTSPVPAWAYFVARFIMAALIASCAVTLVCGVGVVFLHASISGHEVVRLVLTAVAGLITAFAIGLAAATLVPSALAALPLAYAVLLPVSFISQLFFPAPTEARWLHDLAAALPIQPFANGMEAAFRASPNPLGVHGLLVMAGWTLGSGVVALWRFSWEPRTRHRRNLRQPIASR